MLRKLDIEIYGPLHEWAQGRYLVHGAEDVLWTDSLEDALAFLGESCDIKYDEV